MFRKILGAAGILLLAVVVILNVQGHSNAKGKKLKGSILVAGSTSVQPFAELLAEEFQAKNPGVRIDVQGGGSGAGIKSAQSGAADIGTSSRELNPDEKGLNEVEIALDGIAVVVNPKNKVKDLTLEQIKKIFTGEIKNWKELGGTDKEIVVVNREEGSGTRGAFEELVIGKNAKITKNSIVQGSTGAVEQTVAGADNAIGYMSLANVNEKVVKALKVNGVVASEQTIQKKQYKIVRPFLFLTKDKPTGVVKAFINFAVSKEGQAILAKEGLVKVK